MQRTAHGTFAIANWDEKPYGEGEGIPKLMRATVTKTLKGDLVGESEVQYLMMYRADHTASFVGLERITGTLGGKRGSFVLQRTGVFEDGQAKETYTIIPGSGTGELQGLTGQGSTSVGHGMEHPFELTYELPA